LIFRLHAFLAHFLSDGSAVNPPHGYYLLGIGKSTASPDAVWSQIFQIAILY